MPFAPRGGGGTPRCAFTVKTLGKAADRAGDGGAGGAVRRTDFDLVRRGKGASLRGVIYLDHNASAPLLPVARAAWLDAVERFPGNPSSPHRLGARAEAALAEARRRLADWLGCAPHEVLWTSGATEGANAVMHHLGVGGGAGGGAGGGGSAAAGRPVWLSAIEHPAVRESARHWLGGRVEEIPVDAQGRVESAWLRRELAAGRRPAAVAVMAANNETGVLQPWREVQALCAEAGVDFVCDATQWCGRRTGRGLGACAFVIGSAHKFGGPRGVGFLKVPGGRTFQPWLRGGGQLEGRRAGTENVAGVLAMLAALEWSEAQLAAGGEAERLALRERFLAALRADWPGVRVNGEGAERLWNTVSLILPESDCRQRWVVRLDKAGFAVSTGSACASGAEKPSHVLAAMGLRADEAARVVRLSSGWTTTEEEWTGLRAAIVTVARAQGAAAVGGAGERRRSAP